MKPKLLYIDRNPFSWSNPGTRNEYSNREHDIYRTLAERYNVFLLHDLLDIADEAFKGYDILLTHLQDDKETKYFSYHESIEKLKRIRQAYPQLKIIIYTGADPRGASCDDLKKAGVSAVVRKRNIKRLNEDIAEINKCLEEILQSELKNHPSWLG
jgi:hypothetical protein